MKTPKERYENDNHFRALVDMMVNFIQQADYTPSEMRQAAILASIIHEQITLRPIHLTEIPPEVERSIQAVEKWSRKWINSR